MNMAISVTLSETNIAPKNGWLEDEISFRDGLFGGAFAVIFRQCKLTWLARNQPLFAMSVYYIHLTLFIVDIPLTATCISF